MAIPKVSKNFVKTFDELYGDRYDFLGLCEGGIKFKVRHKECGYEWDTYPCNFIKMLKNGKKCPDCSGKPRYTTETFNKKLDKIYKGEYSFITEYKGAFTSGVFIHNKCGCKWEDEPHNFLYFGGRCPKCYGYKNAGKNNHKPLDKNVKNYLPEKDFLKTLKKLYGKEYKLTGVYSGSFRDTQFQHTVCGHPFIAKPRDLLNDPFCCPFCYSKVSKGELYIRRYLIKNNFKYDYQYCFNDLFIKISSKLSKKHLLKFDFVVFDNNENIIYIIEYDGGQHFRPIKFFGGKRQFKKTVKYDIVKNLYCANNDIPLIRIPYWEFNNIEKYLDYYLKNINIIAS